jgi:hypothetical protein
MTPEAFRWQVALAYLLDHFAFFAASGQLTSVVRQYSSAYLPRTPYPFIM